MEKSNIFRPNERPISWHDTRTRTVNFRISPNEDRALKQIARTMYMDRSEVIRDALRMYFETMTDVYRSKDNETP